MASFFRRLFSRDKAETEPQSSYLPSASWDELLRPRSDGMPPLKLKPYKGELWLAEMTTGQYVNVGNRKLRGMGVWTVNVRGTKYHEDAVAATDWSPGSPLLVVREAENEFDPNAVAVSGPNGEGVVGYFNKQMAAALSKQIDGGTNFQAIALGRRRVLAATRETMDWLLS